MPKCVSGHLESFKTHLFLGEKKYSVEKMYSVDSLTCAVGVVESEVILGPNGRWGIHIHSLDRITRCRRENKF